MQAIEDNGAFRLFVSRWWRAGSMLILLALVFVAAAWSAAQERAAAVVDFSHEQESIATAVGIDFENRLALLSPDKLGLPSGEAFLDGSVLSLLGGARRLEEKHDLMVLIARPSRAGFLTTDRRMIPSARLRAALDGPDATVMIPRDEAVAFGLPRRLAVAGLYRIRSVDKGSWGVVVLASAARIRLRQDHEWIRLGITVVTVTVLVAAFGAMNQRRQRRQLELERLVAISSMEREHERLLSKADKMAALAALSTGIAHEIGTPLGTIVGRVEQTLARTKDDERSTNALNTVLTQVNRIQAIIRGCLALARGDAPHLVQTSPESVARRASDLVRHRFVQSGVTFICDVDPGLPLFACEPSLFEQALVNLLLNGCQATPAGGKVRLHVHSSDRRVCFVVDDDGVGISSDVASRATEPFFSTKRDEGGSGLGLTIAREIVNHHGGTLSLERREGGSGTRATIAIAT